MPKTDKKPRRPITEMTAHEFEPSTFDTDPNRRTCAQCGNAPGATFHT